MTLRQAWLLLLIRSIFVPMFIDIVPNRNSPPAAVLGRESWREGKKPHKRTVANLTGLPDEAIGA
jgi:hypothetical protein